MHFFKKLKQTLIYFLLVPIGSLVAQTTIDSPPETISLAQALQRAITTDPRLKLNATFAEAAEGQVEQANLSPNPVVGTEFENFLGTGPVSGIGGIEITLSVSQVIEYCSQIIDFYTVRSSSTLQQDCGYTLRLHVLKTYVYCKQLVNEPARPDGAQSQLIEFDHCGGELCTRLDLLCKYCIDLHTCTCTADNDRTEKLQYKSMYVILL